MSDELLIACAECGVPFEASPDSFVEVGMSPAEATDEQMAEFEESDARPLTREDLATMDDAGLRALGLDRAAADALLRGEDVTTGAIALCPKCLAAFEAGEMFPGQSDH